MAGYVYLIGSPLFSWYKIGKSRTPEIRVQDIGILLPFRIVVVGIWRAENHTSLESLLHQKYAGQRVNGEWFRFTRATVDRLFDSLPSKARIFPSEGHPDSIFAHFSNIERDCAENEWISVRVRKMKGNFTLEEREKRKQDSIAEQRKKQALKKAQKLLDFQKEGMVQSTQAGEKTG